MWLVSMGDFLKTHTQIANARCVRKPLGLCHKEKVGGFNPLPTPQSQLYPILSGTVVGRGKLKAPHTTILIQLHHPVSHLFILKLAHHMTNSKDWP